jgi:phenylacetate-coenzyme A ligase PaaK-like adenylate-forming protein
LGNSILIHGGGWKKLANEQVSNGEFKRRLAERFGMLRIYNYYGMVEQTGSIFMECEAGLFHASQYSDVLVRDPESLNPLAPGQKGLLQLMSTIPRSYPGHAILTEDLGTLIGEDDCACGRKGKYFEVEGRLPQAELRGCSDTHQEKP